MTARCPLFRSTTRSKRPLPSSNRDGRGRANFTDASSTGPARSTKDSSRCSGNRIRGCSISFAAVPGAMCRSSCGHWVRCLKSSRLPEPVAQALGIWTHVAGQLAGAAPSPLALVTSVIHRDGACYPDGGIGTIPQVLFRVASETGVEFRFCTRARRITCNNKVVQGVELDDETLPADAVVSNAGLATYTKLLDENGQTALTNSTRQYFEKLPLQSPGVCAYLAVKGKPEPPYLRFRLRNEPDGCRLLVTPAVIEPSLEHAGWYPARLIAPMSHARAETGGEAGQREFLDRVVEKENWWRELFEDVRVLQTRIPNEWGSHFHLHNNSMNPVMTSRFMLAGRVAHRSPWIRNLYLAGSATHPGQWVSFCAVSGILAADRLLADVGAGP